MRPAFSNTSRPLLIALARLVARSLRRAAARPRPLPRPRREVSRWPSRRPLRRRPSFRNENTSSARCAPTSSLAWQGMTTPSPAPPQPATRPSRNGPTTPRRARGGLAGRPVRGRTEAGHAPTRRGQRRSGEGIVGPWHGGDGSRRRPCAGRRRRPHPQGCQDVCVLSLPPRPGSGGRLRSLLQ